MGQQPIPQFAIGQGRSAKFAVDPIAHRQLKSVGVQILGVVPALKVNATLAHAAVEFGEIEFQICREFLERGCLHARAASGGGQFESHGKNRIFLLGQAVGQGGIVA